MSLNFSKGPWLSKFLFPRRYLWDPHILLWIRLYDPSCTWEMTLGFNFWWYYPQMQQILARTIKRGQYTEVTGEEMDSNFYSPYIFISSWFWNLTLDMMIDGHRIRTYAAGNQGCNFGCLCFLIRCMYVFWLNFFVFFYWLIALPCTLVHLQTYSRPCTDTLGLSTWLLYATTEC